MGTPNPSSVRRGTNPSNQHHHEGFHLPCLRGRRHGRGRPPVPLQQLLQLQALLLWRLQDLWRLQGILLSDELTLDGPRISTTTKTKNEKPRRTSFRRNPA